MQRTLRDYGTVTVKLEASDEIESKMPEANHNENDSENEELAVFDEEGQYLAVPRIPEQYRASDIIGKRIQASSKSNAIRIGPIKNKSKLRDLWNSLSDTRKYILMLISEHRHLTQMQLRVLVQQPSMLLARDGKHFDSFKTYYKWVTEQKYGVSGMSYKKTFMTKTDKGMSRILDDLCDKQLIERITPAYSVDDREISDRYKEVPSLFTQHYYLTALGAKVLIINTDANRTTSRTKPVGFVPTYKNAAFQTILHEAECTEILCSLASCALYASNPDDGKNYGFFDVCRFYHEKDVEEKDVTYKGKKIDFKSDGKFTMYVSKLNDFIDWYIEYDSGSSTKDKIKHKTEAFIKYIFWKRHSYGPGFRKPVLLLATQKPSDLFPQLSGRKSTPYTTGVKNMAKDCFSEYLSVLNDMATVLIADCSSIRKCGTLGACWHRMDLTTGIAETQSYDLITASTRSIRT